VVGDFFGRQNRTIGRARTNFENLIGAKITHPDVILKEHQALLFPEKNTEPLALAILLPLAFPLGCVFFATIFIVVR